MTSPETRPTRLLGPAADWQEVWNRGCCPVCGLATEECVRTRGAQPLQAGSHGYTRVTYPNLIDRIGA